MSKQKPTRRSKSNGRGASEALNLATSGITDAGQFKQVMLAMMSDLLAGHVTPGVGNAVCNAGGKVLKMVEMEHKFAALPRRATQPARLVLAPQAE